MLLIGAGDTIELAARHLAEAQVKRLLVANRTLEHAQELASRHGGVALPLAEIDRHLAEADIVISATASREPVLQRAQVAAALAHAPAPADVPARPRRAARHRPPTSPTLKDVFLYTVDDLERVDRGQPPQPPRGRATQAEAIVDLQVARFMESWRAQCPHGPLKRLRAHGEARARRRAGQGAAAAGQRARIRDARAATSSRTR